MYVWDVIYCLMVDKDRKDLKFSQGCLFLLGTITYPFPKRDFGDDSPFPKVGYGSFVKSTPQQQGKTKKTNFGKIPSVFELFTPTSWCSIPTLLVIW